MINTKIKTQITYSTLDFLNSPYIIQIITEEEIQNYGAKDLMELLRYINYIDFGTDVIGQSGIIVNGIWGHEGRVLIMIDGIPMNEFMYGTTQFGFHYPLDNIKKIKIIQGSGSILYGTFAELMVINIITKQPKSKKQITLNSSFGYNAQKPLFYSNKSLSFLNKTKKNIKISAFSRISKGYRSTFNYTDIYDNSFNLIENKLDNIFTNLKLQYKNLTISSVYDNYSTTSRDYFVSITSHAYPKTFTTFGSALDYKMNLTKKILVNLNLVLKKDKPWVSREINNPIDSQYYSNIQEVNTIYPKFFFTFFLNNNFILNTGSELLYNKAIDKSPIPIIFWNGKVKVENKTFSNFIELYYSNNKDLTLTIGQRIEYNPIYGFTFLPRLGISKNYNNNLIFKITYDKSFRSPTIANLSYNFPLFIADQYPLIVPEINNFINSEITSFFTNNISLSFKAFYLNTKNAITYFVDENGNEGYANVAHLSTTGFSLKLTYLTKKISLKIFLDLQQCIDYDTLNLYYISTKENTYLGISKIKYTLLLKYNINKRLSFRSNFIFLSPKQAYYKYDTQKNELLSTTLPPLFLLSPGISFNEKSISASIDIYNLLNQKDYLVQPYKGLHAPLINKGKTIYFTLQYNFNF